MHGSLISEQNRIIWILHKHFEFSMLISGKLFTINPDPLQTGQSIQKMS